MVEGVVEPKNPMVGSFAGCCARAASGHAAAAPPRRVMTSRRHGLFVPEVPLPSGRISGWSDIAHVTVLT
jgi:hypothetical protein